MTIALPSPIAAYFAADRANPDAVAACFTNAATVKDEGKTYHGKAEIAAWKVSTVKKYTYTTTLAAIDEENGRSVVTAHLAGDFPGGEVDLRYIFAIEGDKITFLHITV